MKYLIIHLLLFGILLIASCETFLNEKPSAKIATPHSLEDIELLLNDYGKFNNVYPSAGEFASDNFYVNDASLNGASERERKAYKWEPNDDVAPYWNHPYSIIFSANVILETLDKIQNIPQQKKTNYYAKALFWRGLYHYSLTQLFSKPYNEKYASNTLGIPLKRTADINDIPQRSNLQETYQFIINDLKIAISGLERDNFKKHQPSKAAGYGLLARVYISMGDYHNARFYADSALQIQSTLIDYNTIGLIQNIPFAERNEEVILDVRAPISYLLNRSRGRIDSLLIKTYHPNDLRLQAFFTNNADGSKGFKGHYSGLSTAVQFTGLAVDEMYLIRSESRARLGDITGAQDDLNKLLKTRWLKNSYQNITESNGQKLLDIILLERRKQLLMRSIRWSDLRRLNQEDRYKQVLYRKLDNETLRLEPESDRYVFKIQRESILFSGIEQNP